MPHSVSIIGLGYVGSVTAACLASKGNHVIGVDTNPQKVAAIDAGRSPVLEKGVNEMIAESHADGRLRATTDAAAAVEATEISFVCVGTPSLRNGRLDLSSVERVCHEMGRALEQKESFHVVVLRSTILPGTAHTIAIPALEATSGKRSGKDFAVCVNPEFMREGCAVVDFHNPPFTILGADDPAHLAVLRQLYEWVPGRIFETTVKTAEMVKYVCNCFHAVKVGFANEIGTLCRRMGVDAEAVTEIFTSDTRLNISPAYLAPGFAFGGSCLPKDLRALTYRARELDLRLPLLDSVLPSNQEHLERAVESVLHSGKKRIGILGLSFKVGTDDLRESPLVQLIKRLLGEGCSLQIWDHDVSLGRLVGSNREYIEEVIPHIGSLLQPELAEVIHNAEVVLIGTRAVDRQTIEQEVRPEQIVIDLVNLEKVRRPQGLNQYEGICW
jgi:GDP-mannose 6-dehydrogenase